MAKTQKKQQSNGLSDTWDYIMAHAQDDDIKVKIDDAMEALERAYPEQLRGLFPRIFAEEHNGTDLIGSVYEYFYGVFGASAGGAT